MAQTTSLAALVSALPVGLLVETAQRRVQVVNGTFCDIFRIPASPEQLTGADCAAAAESVADQFADPVGFLAGIESILAAREDVRGEELAMSDGRVLERDSLCVDLGQGARQIVWVYRDITALATARRNATAARDQALRLAQQRLTMLATVAHEVRTPLAGLAGMTEALEGAPLPGWARQATAAIRESADSLAQLLDDLLDLGRLDVDSQALRAAPYDLDGLLAEAVETVGATARRSGVLLTSRSTSNVPPVVMGDAPRLRQVVLNLLANAVRAAAAGEVSVTADCDDTLLTIVVVDDGPGIDPAVVDRIFDAFVQGDVGSVDGPHGAGLGLAITAQIVERMGGHISIDEGVPQGARFVVSLPLVLPRATGATRPRAPERPLASTRVALRTPSQATRAALTQMLEARGATVRLTSAEDVDAVVVVADASDPRARRSVAASIRQHPRARHVLLTRRAAARDAVDGAVTLGLPPNPGSLVAAIKGADERLSRLRETQPAARARVLVAEDDEVTRTSVAVMLSQLGASVQVVCDGQSAVTVALESAPDLVLLDLGLPQLPGIDAVAQIRADERGRDPTLVVVSASASDSLRSRALAAGADAYIAKPVSRNQLHELLVGAAPTADQPASAPSSAPGAEVPSEAAVDVERLHQLEVELGDAGIVREVVEAFADELGRRLDAVTRSVAAADVGAIHASVHALGSPALMLGATRLGRRCRQIEATSDMFEIRDLVAALPAVAAVTLAELTDYLDEARSAEWSPSHRVVAARSSSSPNGLLK